MQASNLSTAVSVASIHTGSEAPMAAAGLIYLFSHDRRLSSRVIVEGPGIVKCRPGETTDMLDEIVRNFLHKSESDWLWFIDPDVVVNSETIERLIRAAEITGSPVVGGLCFGDSETARSIVPSRKMYPNLYDQIVSESGEAIFKVRTRYPLNSIIEVAGTSIDCLLVHRSILAKIEDSYGACWFSIMRQPGEKSLPESLSFCNRVHDVGARVIVHTGAKAERYRKLPLKEHDYWEQIVPDPAKTEVAVIVPVMNRPKNAEPFMQSLRSSTGLARVYAVAHFNDEETAQAWSDAGANVLRTEVITYAKKINYGYRNSHEPWVYLVGDDARFHPGWLDHALFVADDNVHVVGTNDLIMPGSMRGENAAQLLIRRSYIDEVGASWDGPKNVCHEGYGHIGSDTEIVNAAKQRGCWAMAVGSHVEHLHPSTGKSDYDGVNQLARSTTFDDCLLYVNRVAESMEGSGS